MASLRDLGLSEYEERAYRSLLETGPTTAKELSRTSDVPMGRIYDVLNSLETHSLVRSQVASRPKKYVAVESETALDRLLESKKAELEQQAEQYEQVVDELVDELDAAEPVEEPFWTAAVGPAEAVDLQVERLDAADESIVIVASSLVQQFDADDLAARFIAALEDALERGVSVSVLLTPELVDTLPERVAVGCTDVPVCRRPVRRNPELIDNRPYESAVGSAGPAVRPRYSWLVRQFERPTSSTGSELSGE
ncbi:transcriptional regulator [Halobacteriales archaeon QH_7_68_42]|nr:MAG: transcriptional regulator [Halobacteriales archaeon QH_7_68_42]